MTETNAYVCSVAGGDYLERVSSPPFVSVEGVSEADNVARKYRTTCSYL